MSRPTAGYQGPGTTQDRAIAGQGTTAAQWRAWTGWPGLRAATVDELVPPGHRVVVAFDADNPGRWAFHCHNLYHMATGMITEFRYDGVV